MNNKINTQLNPLGVGERIYRVIVVDDEMYITDSVYNYLNGLSRFQLDVYKAYSAHEALDYMRTANFDIVISDIHMPAMNGIDFMTEVKENWPFCRFIILTGYSEFDYVYLAMKYNCSAYILKADGYDPIEQALEKAIKDIEISLHSERFREIRKKNIETDLPIFQKEFFADLIMDNNHPNDIEESMNKLGMPFFYQHPPMMVTIKYIEEKNISTNLARARQKSTLLSHVQNFLGEQFHIYQVELESCMLIWILQAKEHFDLHSKLGQDKYAKTCSFLNRCIETLQSLMFDKLSMRTKILVDTEFHSWESMSDRYRMAKSTLMQIDARDSDAQILVRGSQDLVFFDQTDDNEKLEILRSMLLHSLDRLESMLEQCAKMEVINWLKDCRKLFCRTTKADFLPSYELYLKIITIYLSYVRKYGLEHLFSQDCLSVCLFQNSSEGKLVDAIELLIVFTDLNVCNKHNSSDRELLLRVESYILANLSSKLSLIQVANAVHYNPSYLSRIFKAAYGINLFDYINTLKMEKAKELLETTDMKIYDIALSVGFNSLGYFYSFFKRSCGSTPQDYRSLKI